MAVRGTRQTPPSSFITIMADTRVIITILIVIINSDKKEKENKPSNDNKK